MTLKLKSVDELLTIASAGGGFRLDCSLKSTDELCQIAAAAHTSGATVIMFGINLKTTEELVKIAEASQGAVIFEDKI